MKTVLIKKLLNYISELTKSRLFVLSAFFTLLFGLLIYKVFVLQVIEGKNYLESFTYRIQKDTELPSSRGTIYDRNGKIIAYNRLANSITIEDSSLLDTNASKNAMIHQLIQLIENSGYEAVYNIPIHLYEDGTLEFTAKGNTLLRFIRNVYGKDNIDQLSEEQKNVTVEELFDYMCHGNDDTSMFGIDDSYSVEDALKIAAIRYELYMKRYEQYLSVNIVSDVSDTLVTKIKENTAELPGVTIEQDYIRQYEDSKYFSNITGYCGQISEDELEYFKQAGNNDYASGDIVGKTGIEKSFEEELQGKKGRQTVYVDSLGNILEVADRVEPTQGNNLYLTLDKDYQTKAYDLLEEEIAGIVLQKLSDSKEGRIDINDVYFAFIKNGIIDLDHMAQKDASDLEKTVYGMYTAHEGSKFDIIRHLLDGTNKNSYNGCSEEEREYIELIENIITNNGILDTSRLSSDDEDSQKWATGNISLYEYLHYAVGKDAVSVSALDISNTFLSSDEIYAALAEYILLDLEENKSFSKIVYESMLNQGIINGSQICQLLYEQNVLEKDADYEGLVTGALDPYAFVYNKIKNLEITPDMLALDPCSGSLVATDPKTGEVLALVSYPSYDANRIGDSDYYRYLLENESLPLYNRATMQKTAPGSTFKMLTAAAGLEEGVITPESYITTLITFDKVQPPANCWSTQVSHGTIEITDAIKESCNYFFYEVGYRLGLDSDGYYNSEYGIQRLRKYMALFGLDRTSGIELEELEPTMSDMDPVLSAIGQARNSYTPAQIARYLTTIASKGDLYSLSILDKLTDSKETLIEDYAPEILEHIELKPSTWKSIFSGMYKVIGNSSFLSIFSDLSVEVAGKSGTAQENALRPDHGLFVCFAPYDDPEITVTVVLPYGYGSYNSGSVAKNMLSYVFHENEATDGKRQAADVDGTIVSD